MKTTHLVNMMLCREWCGNLDSQIYGSVSFHDIKDADFVLHSTVNIFSAVKCTTLMFPLLSFLKLMLIFCTPPLSHTHRLSHTSAFLVSWRRVMFPNLGSDGVIVFNNTVYRNSLLVVHHQLIILDDYATKNHKNRRCWLQLKIIGPSTIVNGCTRGTQ